MKHAVSRQTRQQEETTAAEAEKHRAEFARLSEGLEALLGKEGDNAAFDRMHDEIARLRQSLRGDMATALRNEVGEQVRTGIDEGLAGSMESIGQGLAQLGEATQVSAEAVMPRVEALGQQITELRESVSDLPGTLKLNRMEGQLKEMATALEGMARRMDAPRENHFEQEGFAQIESRLDEISRALVAVGGTGEIDLSAIDLSGIGRLESRVDEMSGALDLSGIERLEGRMVDLLAHVEHLAEENQAAREVEAARLGETSREMEELDRLGHQIAALGERLVDIEAHAETSSRAAARVLSHAPDFSGVEDQMTGLAQRLDAMAQADDGARQLAALEAQVAGLASGLERAGFGHVDLSPLELRLAQIENHVAASQNAAVEAAERAAQSVAAMLGERSGEGQMVAELAGELRVMQDAFEQSDHRNTQSIDAVRSVLDTVGDRLASIERGMTGDVGTHSSDVADRLSAIERSITDQNNLSGSLEAALATMRASNREAPAMPAAAAFAAQPQSQPAAATFAYADPAAAEHAFVEAPALDAHEAIAPAVSASPVDPAVLYAEPAEPADADDMLTPGSGAPNLEDIVERASRRLSASASEPVMAEFASPADPAADPQTDVIAAARRAVQATRAELDAVEQERGDESKSGGLAAILDRLPSLNRRSLVLAAIAALFAGSAYYATNVLTRVTAPAPAASQPAAIEMPAQVEPAASAPVENMAAAPIAPAAQTPLPAPLPLDAAPAQPMPLEAAAPEVTTFEVPIQSADASQAEPDAVEPALDAVQTADLGTEAAPERLAPDASARPLAVDVPAGIAPQALRDAARGGDRVAIYEIGVRYSQGRGVKRDMAKAAEWFGRAAERGFAPGEYSLGSLHEKGVGVPRDLDKAAKLYASAAEKGNARAMHNLAVIHAQDTPGAKADFTKALGLWEQAASLGIKDSQFNLGILYARGMGVPQNLEKSHKWFAIAALDGDKDAQAKRDDVANLMAPDQLERAKKLSAGWTAQEPITLANVVEIPAEWNDKGPAKVAKVDASTVTRVQSLLNRAGFGVGKPDGLAGPRTTRAIMEFQRSWSLPMSGKIDAALLNALEDAAA